MRINDTHWCARKSASAHLRRHLPVHLDQLFKQVGVVKQAVADVDAFAGPRCDHASYGGLRAFFGVIVAGGGGGEVRLAHHENAFCCGRRLGAVIFGQFPAGDRVPAEGVEMG
jgi:hypothetical protein